MRAAFAFPLLSLLACFATAAGAADDATVLKPDRVARTVPQFKPLPASSEADRPAGERGVADGGRMAAPALRPTSPGAPLADAAAPTRRERLDALFKGLKREADAGKAAGIASKIQAEWSGSGSATVDLLMLRAGEAMAKEDAAAAYDFLDQAILLQPAYAEAWNRRATLSYTTSAYGKSIADIEQTLRLEPRHFGALMGLGMILEETDRKEKALDTYLRVLGIYPTMKAAQDAVARLADELTGQEI